MAINLSGDGAGEALGWHLRCGFNQLWFQRKRSLWTGLDHILCEWAALLSPLRSSRAWVIVPFSMPLASRPLLLLRPGPSLLTPGSLFFSSTTSSYTSILPRHPPTSPPLKQTKKRVQSLSIPASPTCPKDDPPSLTVPLPAFQKFGGVFYFFSCNPSITSNCFLLQKCGCAMLENNKANRFSQMW